MKYMIKNDPDQTVIEGETALEIIDSIRGGSIWAEDDLYEYCRSLSKRLILADRIYLPSDPEGLVAGMIEKGILIPLKD
jgi:hypothetical protein